MTSYRKYLYVDSLFLFLLLIALFIPFHTLASLPEEEQFQIIQGFFKDEFFELAQEEAEEYLKKFPQGQYRETVLFLKIRAKELSSEDKIEVADEYANYRQEYPAGRWNEEALFREGRLRAGILQHKRSISVLEELTENFPDSQYREIIFYLLGRSYFYVADLAHQNQSSETVAFYQKASDFFSRIQTVEQLTKEQKIERLHLLGLAYHHQQDFQKAKKWLEEYVKHIDDTARQAKIYYQLAQNEWGQKNYKEAIVFFEKLEQFPQFPLRNSTLFFKAEGEYQILLSEPETRQKKARMEAIVELYLNYLKTENNQFKINARERIASLYYQLGQIAWNQQNYKEAIAFFEKLEQFPQFPLRHPALFLIAEGEYQILLSEPKAKQKATRLEAIVLLFQNYLKRKDNQYQDDAKARIASLYYQLGQMQWNLQNYKEAIAFFDKLEQFPRFPLRNPTLFLKAEGEYQILISEPDFEHKGARMEAIIQLYLNYIKTKDRQYQDDANARIASLYYQLGQSEWEKKNYQEAIAFFNELEQFPQFPLRHSTLFLKAEGEYQILINEPEFKQKGARMEDLVQLYQNYLKTGDNQYQDDAKARIASLYYQLGQIEWANQNYKQAIAFFDKLEQFPQFPLRHPTLFLKAEGEYQILQSLPESRHKRAHLENIVMLFQNYLETQDRQYQGEANVRIASLYYQLGQIEWKQQNYKEAIAFFDELEQFPQFSLRYPALFLQAEGQYQILLRKPESEQTRARQEAIIKLYQNYLNSKDSQYASDAKARIALLFYQLGQQEWEKQNYKEAIAFFDELEQFPQFPHRHATLFLKAEGQYQILLSQPKSQHKRARLQAIVQLYQNYLKTKDSQYQDAANERIASLFYQLGQQEWEKQNYKEAIAFFDKLEKFPNFPLRHPTLFLIAEGEYQILLSLPKSQHKRARLEGIVQLFQNYLKTENNQYQSDANARIALLYYQLGQNEWKQQNYQEAIIFFDKLEQFPQFPLRHTTLFLKAEGEYQILQNQPVSQHKRARLESIVVLFHNYLETQDIQYLENARARIALLYYQISQQEWEQQNYKEAIAFFDKLQQFPQFPLHHRTLFLKAEGEYQILLSNPDSDHKRARLEDIVRLYQNYLETGSNEYQNDARARIASLYYQLGQNEWKQQNYKEAIAFFNRLEQFPHFPLRHPTLFLRAEGEYLILQSQPESLHKRARLESIVELYQNYLDTLDSQYESDANARIASLYYQIGQQEWQKQSYREAISYFDKLEQFPQFPLRYPALFLIAEGEYQILQSESEPQSNRDRMESIVELYQNYLKTGDSQYQLDANARIALLYYQLGQNEWKQQNYKEALTFFDKLEQFPQFPLRHPTLFLKAEGEYQILQSQPESQHKRAMLEEIVLLYQNYLKTENSQYREDAKARIASLYYQIGQQEWEKQNYQQAIVFFDKLDIFPQFPLLHPTLFLKAEGEYQLLQRQPESQHQRPRLENIVTLFQNYLQTQDRQYQVDAKARIASLFYQLGQIEWKQQNYQEAIAFFDKLEKFPQFPLRHTTLFLKAEGEYQILLSQPEVHHNQNRLEAIVQLFHNYLESQDNQYQNDANARVASLYYQLGQNEWKKQNFKDAITYFDELEQFPRFPLRDSTLFLKAEGEYQIMLSEPQSQNIQARLQGIIHLYQNYLKTEDSKYQEDAKARIASLYYQLGQNEWKKLNFKDAIAYFDELEQFPQFSLRHPTLFLKAEGEYQILQSQPKSQHTRARLEDILQLFQNYLETNDNQYQEDTNGKIASLYYQLGQNEWELQNYQEAIAYFDKLEQFPQFPLRHPTLFLKAEGEYQILQNQPQSEHKRVHLELIVRLYQNYLETKDSQYQDDAKARIALLYYQIGKQEWEKKNYKEAIEFLDKLIQFPQFPQRFTTLFLKAEGEYQILQMEPESQQKQARMETIIQLYQNYLTTEDSQYRSDARARIASLYYQLGQNEWVNKNYQKAIAFFNELEQFPQFPLRHTTFFLKAEGEYQILQSLPHSEHKRVRLQGIIQLYRDYLKTEDSQYQSNARERIALLYYQLGQQEWQKKNYHEAIAFFDELEQFPQFPLRNPTLFLKAEGEYQILLSQPKLQRERARMENIIQLFQNYLETEDNQYPDDARTRIASLYYQLGQNEWEQEYYKEAIAFFEELEQFPQFPLRHPTLFLIAEGEYLLLTSLPKSQQQRERLEAIVQLFQNYLVTENSQYRSDAKARIASLYYQLGQQQWKKQNYQDAIAYFDELEQFPQFPLRHPTLFLKAEGEYQLLQSEPKSRRVRARLEAIVQLFQNYLETADNQYQVDARDRIASLYYQIGQQEWEKKNYKEAIAFFDELEQFPKFPLRHPTLFLKAEGKYQILQSLPESEHIQARLESIIQLYQNYLKTKDSQYQGQAKARIAALYYQLGQQQWEKKNYQDAITYFDELEQFPQFPLRHPTLFLKAEGEYQILQSLPESQHERTLLENIVQLFQNYLKTGNRQYHDDAKARIASLYYQLGQQEWDKKNYKDAIVFFEKLEQFPQFPLLNPTLFLKAEGEYQILLNEPTAQLKRDSMESIVQLYQIYLKTGDTQYRSDARARIATLYYELAQGEWKKQNYEGAIAFFDKLEQFPQFPLRFTALFLKAEGEYQLLLKQPEFQHNREIMEAIVQLYQSYLETEDGQYQSDARARIASLYYQLGQSEWEKKNYKEAIAFFNELEQFPKFPLRNSTLFLKAEGEYQILQSLSQSQQERARLEAIVQLFLNYLETEDSQYHSDARARIASLYYQLGQSEWEEKNFQEAIAFFDELEQFPNFPLRLPTLFLKAEGEYQILQSLPQSLHERDRLETIVLLFQNYLESEDSQYQSDAKARIATLYYQLGQQEWEKKNYQEAISFFDNLQQFPNFPLRHSTLFLKAEGEYQILLKEPESQHKIARLEGIVMLYKNYLETEDSQFQDDAKARIASLYYQLGQQQWEKQNYEEAIVYFDELEQFPEFPLRHPTLFLKAEGEYQILQNLPESQHKQARLESIVQLYKNYLITDDNQYQSDANSRIAALYYQLGQQQWEKKNYKDAISYFDELEQFPKFPLRHPTLFLKAEGEYQILQSLPQSQQERARLEVIVHLFLNYLETHDSQYQDDAKAKIASLYYQIGQQEWEKKNYKEAIAIFDELEHFPKFPLRHPTLFLKAEGEYQILQSLPKSEHMQARLESIIQLFQNYLVTEDSQYQGEAKARIASLFYQLGQQKWKKQNYQEAIAFFEKLEQFPQFPLRFHALFLKAEGEYQILQSLPQSQHERTLLENIVQLFQNYLKTGDSQYHDDANARIAALYYRLGQNEWEIKNYKDAISYFDELEQFSEFPLRHPTLFLKAEGEYLILLSEPASQHKRSRLEAIVKLFHNYLKTGDSQYHDDANARIAALYYQLGQNEWEKQNYQQAIAFYDKLELFPNFPLQNPTLFLKAEGEYQILQKQPKSQHEGARLEAIVQLYKIYLETEDEQYRSDARARIAALYYQLGQQEWEKQNYQQAIAFFEILEKFPLFPLRHSTLFLKAEGEYQLLQRQPQSQHERASLQRIIQLFQNYLDSEDGEYQGDAKARIASLYYQLAQGEWEKQNYQQAIAFFDELQQFPQFPLLNPTLFLKAEGEYQILQKQPKSQYDRSRLEAVVNLFQNYLDTEDHQYQNDANARIASLYYQLGQEEWEKQNYQEALAFFDKLEQFPLFPLRHPTLFLKAEGEYQILLNKPESKHNGAHLEAIVELYQIYLNTEDSQYQSDARARIASLYYQLGQQQWEKQNYQEALAFFEELVQYPQFPLRLSTLFLKAEGQYQIILNQPESQQNRARKEEIILLYQNYLNTEDMQYRSDARERIASLYYQLGQSEWKKKNYQDAIAFFDELERFPKFPLRHPTLFLKGEGEYQIMQSQPKSQHKKARMESIIQLYQNYLKTGDDQYQKDANARIASLYYQLGQNEWGKKNYREAISYFDELELFPQFPLRHTTLFLKAEGEYQIMLSLPTSQQIRTRLEAIVQLFQNYLATQDSQYQNDAEARIALLYYQLGQQEWKKQNYQEAITFFDELEQFPQFPLRNSTLFLKAEGEYQLLQSQPEFQRDRARLETILQLYQNYLNTKDNEFEDDARARIASLYYQLGQQEWEKQNYQEAIAFFDELEQFPQFPLRLPTLFLKAEGEYQILLSQSDPQHKGDRMKAIIALYQNYLETEDDQYQADAKARIASLYYQLGQDEWKKQNYQEAISFFDKLDQFPQFPLRHPALFLKAEGEYQILLSQPESQHQRARMESVIQFYQNYLKTGDDQYQIDANARIASLYYQIGQDQWEKQNYQEAISFFDKLEQFPQFPLRHPALFLKAEGEYQILLSQPESQHQRARLEGIVQLYQNYLKTQDSQYQDDAKARIASLFYQLGQNEWKKKNYQEAIAFFDELEQFPNFPLRQPTLFLKAEGEYQILLSQPELQHQRARTENIIQLYQNYLKTGDDQYQKDANARIASLYYQLGQNEWEKKNYQEAIALFDELEQFPQFPLRHTALFLKAEGEYQILLSQSESQHEWAHLQTIVQLYQNYLETQDSQFRDDARARIASLYYQLGQIEWEKQNYEEAITFFDKLEQFQKFPLRHSTLFLKAEGEYQILMSQSQSQHKRVRMEDIVQLYQNYLQTGDSQYQDDARSRIASLYYQLGQIEWEKQNYKEAITFFDELESFPQFPLRLPILFLKAEGEYKILLSQPELQVKQHHLEAIVRLYQNYLETEDSQYRDDARARIASLFYRLGQIEWEKPNYQKAIAFFDKLEQFPHFHLRHSTLFFKAEGEYQILLSQPELQNKKARLQTIVKLYQNYLNTEDNQYQEEAHARIASLNYQLGQINWDNENYEEAVEYFDELEKYPQFPFRHSALFFKAEGEYQIMLNQAKSQHSATRLEEIIQLYQDYHKTEDSRYQSDAKMRIASLYFQLGQNEWEKGNYKEAFTFFDKLEQFPQFPLHHIILFLKAEGEYQMLLIEPESLQKRSRVESVVQLYQNYLETQDHQYKENARARIASLYYQLGQYEWEKNNYKEAIAFFAKLEQFPRFPLRLTTLFLKAEGEYQILLSQPESQFKKARKKSIIQLFQDYLITKDNQYQDQAKARIALLFYQLGESEWEKENYEEAIAYFDELEQFPQFPLRNPTLFLKAEGKYQILFQQQETQHTRARVEAIAALYENYLKTEDKQYQARAFHRLGKLYHDINEPQKTISYYTQYLETGDKTHDAGVHYELGQLFFEQKDFVQAIRALKLASKSNEYQNDGELILQLSQLLEKENQHLELQNLLAVAKNNTALSDQHRNYFRIKDVNTALKNNQCKKILKENIELPASLNQEDRHFILYARSICLHQTKQWERAADDLNAIINNPDYESFAFEKLIEIYQESKEWNSLAMHIEEYLKRKDFPLLPIHFQTLLNAYHQLKDWKKLVATYIRWDSVSPNDVQKAEFLIDWAETEEKLNRFEKSRDLYRRVLSLPEINLELREGIVFHLADSYLIDEDYRSLIEIYEQDLIPYLNETKTLQNYALSLGQIYYDPLQEYDKARQWLQKVDRGQASDLEIRAILLLSDIAEELAEMDKAIELLNDLTLRSLKPEWGLNVNYRLAILYEKRQQLPNALEKYRVMASQKSITKKEDRELQKYAQKRILEIEKNNAIQKLDHLIKNKSWQDVAIHIRNGFDNQSFAPSHELFEILVYAERQQSNWQGILDAYLSWGKFDPSKAESLEALLSQGEAALQILDNKLAEKFYSNALNIVPIEDLATRIFLTKNLAFIYEQENQYSKVVAVYEQSYPYLRDSQDRIQFAYKLGSYYLSPLDDKTQAQKWFSEADKGGILEEELSAAWQLAELESNSDKTIKILAKLASRPISNNLEWFITVNLKLGILYEQQEKWRKAKLHYDRVVKSSNSEYEKYEQFARERSSTIADYLKSLRESQ